MIMMLVGALVVLAGGGAGAYFYFMQPAEASAPEGEDHEVAKKEEKHEDVHYEYVELEPLVLPIVDKKGVSQVVSLVVALEVDGHGDDVRKMEPRLKDAYIQELYGMLNEHAALKGGVIQVGYIKSKLKDISQEVLPEGGIHDVLLQVVQQRPM